MDRSGKIIIGLALIALIYMLVTLIYDFFRAYINYI